MAKERVLFTCAECGRASAQWAGRCSGCGAWGSFQERPAASAGAALPTALETLATASEPERRVGTGSEGLDRVLGGGLVPGSVILLAGGPGIGKSTLLMQLMAGLARAGERCLLVSGEESRAQVAARARRLGIDGAAVHFAPGRELPGILATALAARPFLLAVDSIQTVRDPESQTMPGGPSQVRACTDALVGLAKAEGISIVLAGHVTKDGDLAGPRTLEHAVDVVLSFDGDPSSGLRVISGGKNRFGAEGETAWFEMGQDGLHEIDPTELLRSADRLPGAATALPLAGRRALAVEVQALVGSMDGPARRHTSGLDLRRFQLVAAVLDRALGLSLSRAELFGSAAGGYQVRDPSCDLAMAAAIASAATGSAPPAECAFVGEVGLTGAIGRAPGFAQRVGAARAAGIRTVFAAPAARAVPDVEVVAVRHVSDAFGWLSRGGRRTDRRSA